MYKKNQDLVYTRNVPNATKLQTKTINNLVHGKYSKRLNFQSIQAVHVVAISSMNFPSKIQIYKTWMEVLALKTQLNANIKLYRT